MGVMLSKGRRDADGGADAGSITGRIAWVLAVVTIAFAVFVGLKYFVLDKEDGASPDPTTTVTATGGANPTPSDEPDPSPTPTTGEFDGTWVGFVTGDVHTYDVEVVIDDDGETLTGEVTYIWNPARPGIEDCVGEWTQTGRHAKHVDIHEVITNTEDSKCIEEVDITLDLKPNGTVAFAIFYDDEFHPKSTLHEED